MAALCDVLLQSAAEHLRQVAADGIPAWLQHQQGWAYLYDSISHELDITLGTIALAAVLVHAGAGAARAAIGALLYESAPSASAAIS